MQGDKLSVTTTLKSPKRLLRNSLLAMGLLVLSALTFIIGYDSLYSMHSKIVSRTLFVLFYALMILAAIVAVLTLKNCFEVIKTSKDSRNYIAIVICILVLLAIIGDILQRF
jgi:Kef-type K+ transport system membrane component KefB